MSKSRPRQHTVLPKAQLRDYFPGGNGFAVYDIQTGKWERKGAKTFCVWRGYYGEEHENALSKIESAAINSVRKLANREILDESERRKVSEYIVASLFRNRPMIEKTLRETIAEVRDSLPGEIADVAPWVEESEVLDVIERLENDESSLQQFRSDATTRNPKLYEELADRIERLCWHIVHVERPPTYFLLTDQPFQRGPLGNDEEAWLGFPISSDVLLYMNHHPSERWLKYPMQRTHVIDYGRTLVKSADRYVAAPQEDKDLTRMIQRLRPPISR